MSKTPVAQQPTTTTEEEKATLLKRPHRKGWFQWVPTDEQQLHESEQRMLSKIQHLIEQETVAGLNTIKTVHPPETEKGKRHLVLVHGFGGGVCNWLPTWKDVAPHTNVYAIDLPGFARSHRPSKKFSNGADDVIDFMSEALVLWLKEMKLDNVKVDLCGHSFGGYIITNFATKHPDQVDKLLLSDPWGVPKASDRQLPWKWRMAIKLFYVGNPLSVLRGAGPWGPGLFQKRRPDFADRWRPHIEDTNDFYDYTYHCNAMTPPTGEQAFQACCTGPGFAQKPLEELVGPKLPKHIHVSVCYGRHTWMDVPAGRRMLEEIKNSGGRCHHEVTLISEAGHQVMSDNAPEYNRWLLERLGHA